MKKIAYELNFDGIVGPTHNYSGMAYGNVASANNKGNTSNPKAAALQGIEKMKALYDLGIKQAVLPPHERPNIHILRKLKYSGSDEQILAKVSKESPDLLHAVSSASSMWAANTATVSPSADTANHKIHITVANLTNKRHRSIEHKTSYEILNKIFADKKLFTVHKALEHNATYWDEGAANHNRFCSDYNELGIELFAYGRYARNSNKPQPQKYPARQTFEASRIIASSHQLHPDHCIFAQQNPDVIDQGVFHNDVISVCNQNVFLYHEKAFLDTDSVLNKLTAKYNKINRDSSQNGELKLIPVPNKLVSVSDAVSSYLFNSQIVSLPRKLDSDIDSSSTQQSKKMILIAPSECEANSKVKDFIDSVVGSFENPIKEVLYFDLKESMRNGGGPACLRLRVPMTSEEIKGCHQGVIFNERLYETLKRWVNRHYRDELSPDDLADPQLLAESRAALDELTQILKLGSIYEFQKESTTAIC